MNSPTSSRTVGYRLAGLLSEDVQKNCQDDGQDDGCRDREIEAEALPLDDDVSRFRKGSLSEKSRIRPTATSTMPKMMSSLPKGAMDQNLLSFPAFGQREGIRPAAGAGRSRPAGAGGRKPDAWPACPTRLPGRSAWLRKGICGPTPAAGGWPGRCA